MSAEFPANNMVGGVLAAGTHGKGHAFGDESTVTANSGAVLLGFPIGDNGGYAGVSVANGTTVKVARYCIEPDGTVRLDIQVLDKGQVRVKTSVPSGGPAVKINVTTNAVTINDIHTDYSVAADGNDAVVSVFDGPVGLTRPAGAGKAPPRLLTGQTAVFRGGAADTLVLSESATPDPALGTLTDSVGRTPLPGVAGAGGVQAPVGTIGPAGEPVGTWRMRMCWNSDVRARAPRLAHLEQSEFALRFNPLGGGSALSGVGEFQAVPMTLSGVFADGIFDVSKWYVGTDPATSTRSHGAARLRLGDGVLSGTWSSALGASGTWVAGLTAPPSCPA